MFPYLVLIIFIQVDKLRKDRNSGVIKEAFSPVRRSFVKSFVKRHSFRLRHPHRIENQRKLACSKENIQSHFERLEHLLMEHKYPNALIFNMDETMVRSTSTKLKVIAPHTCVDPKITIDDQMFHITVCFCVSGAGEHCKPLVILPKVLFPEELDQFADYFAWSGQSSGWITREIFEQWTIKIFMPYVETIRRRSSEFSHCRALLLVDSHSSRAAPETLQMLHDNNVDVLTIPSHTSHLLQPLDRGVNSTFKRALDALPSSTCGMTLAERRKEMIVKMVSGTYSAMSPTVITGAFREAGVIPLSSTIVEQLPQVATPPVKKKCRKALRIDGRVLTSTDFIEELRASQESTSCRSANVPMTASVSTSTSPQKLR